MLRATAAFVFTTLLLLASQGSATTYYGEAFTSELAGDLHARVVADVDFNPLDVRVYDIEVSSPGLGSATIPPTKTVTFSIDPALGQIETAWLYIGLTDDLNPFFDPFDFMSGLTEVAVIEFGGTTWTDEVGGLDWLIAPLIGDVTTEVLADRTNFAVNISSDPTVGGDFQIITAALKVKLSDGLEGVLGDAPGAIPTPEPGALLLFGIGTLVVSAASRR